MDDSKIWVVVACYNEEKLVKGTLDAIATQSDANFSLVVVDNNSTDRTPEILQNFKQNNPQIDLHLIYETEKGTGAAADTGFRYAINNGAKYIARTDADSLPCATWLEHIREDFETGARIIGGRVSPRKDEEIYRWYDGIIAWAIIRICERAPRFFYKRPGQNYPLFMVPGPNMAIEADLYEQAGGFPRAAIDDTDEDLQLHLRVCEMVTKPQARLNKKAKVYSSIRRAKAMGYIGILLWYWGRKRTTEVVDLR